MGNTFYFEWEVRLMEWLQGMIGDAGAAVFSVISTLGEEIALICIFGFVYWCYDKKIGMKIGRNIVTCCVFFPMLKNVFYRRRPYMDHETIQCLKPVEPSADIMDITEQGFSFPSGHSANSAVAYGSLARFFHKKWITVLAFVLPLLVGISRVALGNHYPTDVLCGWLLGALVVIFVPMLYERVKNPAVLYGIFLAVGLLGCFYCTSNDYYTSLGMMIGFYAGDLFEKKYVNFANTKSVLETVLRLLGGFIIYFGLNTLLKLPFPKEVLESATALQFLIRTLRYAVLLFVEIGLYPLLFARVTRLLPSSRSSR